MAPRPPPNPFSTDEKVLCFHMDMLYEAKILDTEQNEEGDGWMYKVHYKGWKNTWDDWVPADRIRRITEENRELAAKLVAQAKAAAQKPASSTKAAKKGSAPVASSSAAARAGDSARDSEERGGGGGGGASSATAPRRSVRSRHDIPEPVTTFEYRPIIKLPLPDFFRALLVDDWENVSKKQQLVPVPHKKPVAFILADYQDYERPKRQNDEASDELLNEIVEGLKQYFDAALPRVLLYNFERPQWDAVYAQIEQAKPGDPIEEPSDAYGAEHLLRLLSRLEEFIALSNMNPPSVLRLREELLKFFTWFMSHAKEYFLKDYQDADSEYIEAARRI